MPLDAAEGDHTTMPIGSAAAPLGPAGAEQVRELLLNALGGESSHPAGECLGDRHLLVDVLEGPPTDPGPLVQHHLVDEKLAWLLSIFGLPRLGGVQDDQTALLGLGRLQE